MFYLVDKFWGSGNVDFTLARVTLSNWILSNPSFISVLCETIKNRIIRTKAFCVTKFKATKMEKAVSVIY